MSAASTNPVVCSSCLRVRRPDQGRDIPRRGRGNSMRRTFICRTCNARRGRPAPGGAA